MNQEIICKYENFRHIFLQLKLFFLILEKYLKRQQTVKQNSKIKEKTTKLKYRPTLIILFYLFILKANYVEKTFKIIIFEKSQFYRQIVINK